MVGYLPELLDGLMTMLSDPNREIKVAAHKAMMEFLVEIQVSAPPALPPPPEPRRGSAQWERVGGVRPDWRQLAGCSTWQGCGCSFSCK
jgi:hypothetical protein